MDHGKGKAPYSYPAKLSRDRASGGFTVTFRDVPEAITEGADKVDAIEAAHDALRTAFEFYIEDGDPTPAPSKPQRGEVLVPLDPITALKAALADAVRETATTHATLARAIEADQKEVRRLLDPRHVSKARRLVEALATFDRTVEIVVR